MKSPNRVARPTSLALAIALAALAPVAGAADLYLRADATTLTVPAAAGPTAIPMWTYSSCDASFANCTSLLNGLGSDGPTVVVPQEPLTIHLQNNLGEPTSVYMPGQQKALVPVRDAGGRITSFDAETAPGTVGTYTWAAPRAGTFLLQSGTHPQKQVHMGLHGAVRVGVSAVPVGVTVAHERTLVFSEIDPVLHADGSAANVRPVNAAPPVRPVPPGELANGYAPRHFLINGRSYPDPALAGLLAGVAPGEAVLLHLVNAGLDSRAPQLLGGEFEVVAEDAHAVPSRHLQNSVLLAAGKSLDLLVVAGAEGTYTLFDRRLKLVSDTLGGAGMMTQFTVVAPPVP